MTLVNKKKVMNFIIIGLGENKKLDAEAAVLPKDNTAPKRPPRKGRAKRQAGAR